MFLNSLVRKRCSVCQKVTRGSILENHSTIGEFINNEFNSEEELCSCSSVHRVYYTSTFLLRAIQTIVLVVIFITTTSTLFMVRNTSTLNMGVSSVISGYSDSQKGLNNFKFGKTSKQFAKLFEEFKAISE